MSTRFSPPPPDAVEAQLTQDAWHEIGRNYKVEVKVSEKGTKIRDFDGRPLNLHHCEYTIEEMASDQLVKKGMDDESLRECYSFIRGFRHPAAVIVHTYLPKGSIVMSMVDGSFRKWLKTKKPEDLLTEDGSMRPVLRNMIIGLVEVVQGLHDQFMYIPDLSMNDLYIKRLDDGTPVIQVLISRARKATLALLAQNWEKVKNIVEGCFAEHNLNQDEVTKRFCACIGAKPGFLRNFPDQWDSSKKSTFLMEKCAFKGLSSCINDSKLKWPMGSDGKYEPLVLILVELGKYYAKYDFGYPNDYVTLLRNTHKLFSTLPKDIQEKLGGNPDGFLNKMEEWSPNIWALLYEATEPKKIRNDL